MKQHIVFIGLLVCLFSTGFLVAQANYRSVAGTITIAGTSSLHNWELVSKNIQVTACFETDPNGKLTEVISLNFTMLSTTLKSGKTGLDENAYQSLDAKNFNNIRFAALQGTVKPAADKLQISCSGLMQVAGKALSTEVTANCAQSADGTLTCTGTKVLKMTDFNIVPPTFMMGTIKTGDEVKLSFSTVLKNQ